MNLLRRLNGLFLRVSQEPIRTKCCNLNLILVDDAQGTDVRRKPLKSVVSLVSKTVRGLHVNMIKENLHFHALE